jgi:hypothetical protein
MKSLKECSKTETTSKIFPTICREESGKKIIFTNELYNIVCDVIDIDGCVFNKIKNERSCDFLFLFDKSTQEYNLLNNKGSLAYYVELKGKDLESACEQLQNTIEKTKTEIEGFDLNALVVSNREFNPKFDNNEFYRNVRRLINKNIVFALTPCTIEL